MGQDSTRKGWGLCKSEVGRVMQGRDGGCDEMVGWVDEGEEWRS